MASGQIAISPGAVFAESDISKAFGLALIVTLCVVWSPMKSLAYLAPFIFVFVYAVRANRAEPLLRLGMLFLGGVVLSCFYYIAEQTFAPQDALISFITYGTFICILCLPARDMVPSDAIQWMFRLLPPVLVVESVIGLSQAAYAAVTQTGSFDSDNGDWVTGTIQLGSAHNSFSNPMFAANMGGMLIALVGISSFLKKPVPKLALILGGAAFLFASVVHATAFLLVALVAAGVLLARSAAFNLKVISLLLVTITLVCGGLILLFPGNMNEFAGYASFYTVLPKTEFLIRIFTILPQEYPQMPLFGFGPGQFGSRAGLIGTGLYFGTPYNPIPLPLLPPVITPQFDHYAIDLWFRTLTSIYFGSTGQPFFSWISVYTEFGLAGVILVLGFCMKAYRALAAQVSLTEAWASLFCCLSLMIFIFLLGFQENYWEVAQAIFIPALCARIMYLRLTEHGPAQTNIVNSSRSRPIEGLPV